MIEIRRFYTLANMGGNCVELTTNDNVQYITLKDARNLVQSLLTNEWSIENNGPFTTLYYEFKYNPVTNETERIM